MASHSIIETENRDLVKTCSECSMDLLNGEINIKGIVHRAFHTNNFGLDCRNCSVHLNSIKTGEFYRILKDIDNEK
jgi:hypothetical protein